MESDAPHAELSDIFVAEPSRRNGVGRALMDFAERHARERGARGMDLIAGAENTGARDFYRTLGYTDFAVAMHKTFEGDS